MGLTGKSSGVGSLPSKGFLFLFLFMKGTALLHCRPFSWGTATYQCRKSNGSAWLLTGTTTVESQIKPFLFHYRLSQLHYSKGNLTHVQIQCNPINTPMTFFTGCWKTILKLIWNHKRHWIAKVILNKMAKACGITIPHFKLYYKAIGLKEQQTNKKNQTWYKGLWNRVESPKANTNKVHWLLWQNAKNAQWTISSINVVKKTQYLHSEEWNWNLISYTKPT